MRHAATFVQTSRGRVHLWVVGRLAGLGTRGPEQRGWQHAKKPVSVRLDPKRQVKSRFVGKLEAVVTCGKTWLSEFLTWLDLQCERGVAIDGDVMVVGYDCDARSCALRLGAFECLRDTGWVHLSDALTLLRRVNQDCTPTIPPLGLV